MKKTITAILLGLSILTFSACSDTNQADDTTASASITTTAAAADTTVAETVEDTTAAEISSDVTEDTTAEEVADTTVGETADTTAENTDDTTTAAETTAEQTTEATTEADTTKFLVAYFSYSGNTRAIAEKISAEVGGDLFEIDTTYDYPSGYNDVLDVAQQEKSDGARPELSATVDNMADYDVVFIGYPNWWADMPMVVYSFLDTYDLSGKTVVPFVTSSSSGFSNTISAIENAEPNAEIAEGLSIRDSAINSSDDEISQWLGGLGY